MVAPRRFKTAVGAVHAEILFSFSASWFKEKDDRSHADTEPGEMLYKNRLPAFSFCRMLSASLKGHGFSNVGVGAGMRRCVAWKGLCVMQLKKVWLRSAAALIGLMVTGFAMEVAAREIHVSVRGADAQDGSDARPLATISAAARRAQPGDTITIHEGIYRERIAPPRGGTSDARRIVYQAAPGETVVLKGSEIIQGWKKVQNDTWQVVIPNTFFGDFNPYSDRIHGDWFNPRGREHHTGAVYLEDHWLTEAPNLEDVLQPVGVTPAWADAGGAQYLLNVAWLQVGARRIPSEGFAAQRGVQTADCSEGGQCIGWIEHGDWVRYDNVDFGDGTEEMEFRAASVTGGGQIEIRLGAPNGDLIGVCPVADTGDWQAWATFKGKIKPTRGQHALCLVFKGPAAKPAPGLRMWFARVDESNTTLWAQFKDVDPNQGQVEINVRQTVFYPEKPGINYLTVRGLTMMCAATPWAPPTAEQVGLIGTHWSKGWIIENCDVRYSTCVGITLGKYGDQWDNTSANTAEGYVKTIERALANGWNKETIGHHIVRNNRISHCEQAGLVGSLGAVFCSITDNTIHDIHVRRLFTGAEMGGIKLHAAIDTTIARNHIYRTCRGLWLDWMAQGTRVTRNLFHDNFGEDVFVEVNHGPFLVDNNLFLSGVNLLNWSQGGAYAHNLFVGRMISQPEPNRETPYHPAHTTEVAGLTHITGGDDRFFNNIFVGNGTPAPSEKRAGLPDMGRHDGYGLWPWNFRKFESLASGNVYLHGAVRYLGDKGFYLADINPGVTLTEQDGEFYLSLDLSPIRGQAQTAPVTTESLGATRISKTRYEKADGTPLRVNEDYFGKPRDTARPTPGPFATIEAGRMTVRAR